MSDIVQQLRGGPRVDRIADMIRECGGCGGRDFPKQHNCQACTDKVDDDADDLMVRAAEEIERLRNQVSLQTTQILEQQNQAMARSEVFLAKAKAYEAIDALIAAETPIDPVVDLRAAWEATQHTGTTPEAGERLESAIAAIEAERRKK